MFLVVFSDEMNRRLGQVFCFAAHRSFLKIADNIDFRHYQIKTGLLTDWELLETFLYLMLFKLTKQSKP